MYITLYVTLYVTLCVKFVLNLALCVTLCVKMAHKYGISRGAVVCYISAFSLVTRLPFRLPHPGISNNLQR